MQLLLSLRCTAVSMPAGLIVHADAEGAGYYLRLEVIPHAVEGSTELHLLWFGIAVLFTDQAATQDQAISAGHTELSIGRVIQSYRSLILE